MDDIEIHMDINVQVVIPEWLRAKMGLTQEVEDDDAENESCDCDDDEDECSCFPETAEEKAVRKAYEKLFDVLTDTERSNISYRLRHDVHRRKPRM